MIKLKNISRFFGQFQAVKNINLEIKQGEVLGFLGPNGAGKTTTIRLITGCILPSDGSILINNIDMEQEPLKAKELIGYLPERAPYWPDMTVGDYLNFCGEMKGMPQTLIKQRIQYVLKICDLDSVFHVAVDTLSKGFKRRVCLAQALLNDPPILILDEPTDGLDPNQKKEMRDLIRTLSKEKTIIISTHILEEVDAVCNKVAIITEGSLVFYGTPMEMRKKSIYAGTITLSFVDKKNKEDEILTSRLEQFMTITHVYYKAGFYRLYLEKGTQIKEVLLQLLNSDIPDIDFIGMDQGHLEDVFYTLTTQGK